MTAYGRGTPETQAKNRARLRRKLVAEGVAPERIEAIIALKKEHQDERRAKLEAPRRRGPGEKPGTTMPLRRAPDEVYVWEGDELVKVERSQLEAETYDRLSLDDSKVRPTSGDPLLRGPARVTGQTAKVVRRGSTIPKWQHDEAS